MSIVQPIVEEVLTSKLPISMYLYTGGNKFICECGCALFHNPSPEFKLVFECNSCTAQYKGEK